jgi:hypothetical protein
MATSQLFEPVPQPRWSNLFARAGAFLVEKSNDRFRMICDARPANCCLDTRRLPRYSLPLVEIYRQVMANVAAAGETFYVISTDWRNAFFQVPLPRRLQKYCVHDVSEPGGPRLLVWPKTLPMVSSLVRSS